ncbi:MAG: SDR family NAD(P)-dependent oxidoreductase, partial [Thermoflavifilum sp.]|nr:SDR family NAD(P)-dependent oxidoreductase [Thermoflavifilum sp.]MCL6515241.1 SDR family NAD(P)-dependent oxidoreductase [Alicyclobacillus sp.]
MRLEDKVCIITGAGSGMGRKAAEMFCQEGAIVAAFEINEQAGRETEALVRANGGRIQFFPCDVADEASVAAAVAETVRSFGRVDVLYNNAGIMPEADHSVIDTSVEVW